LIEYPGFCSGYGVKDMNISHSIENFEQLTKCPLCGSRYYGNGITLLEESDQQTTFHISCENCKVSFMVLVSAGQYGIVSVGMVTDLNKKEAKYFYKTDPISPDQVIEVHECLKKNN
jgi:transcription elongation factor Elf1